MNRPVAGETHLGAAMSSFSAVDAALAGFTLARKRPMLILAWAGLYVAAIIVVGLLAVLLAGPSLMSLGALSGNEDPSAILSMMGGLWLLLLLIVPVLLLMSAMFIGAVFRSMLRPDEKKFAYVTLGGDELRLIVVSIVYMLLFLLCGGVIGGVIAGATMAVGDSLKGLVIFVLILAGLCLAVWLGVRVSLASVQTFAERRLNIFGTWTLTKGRFWPMFGMWVMAVIFVIIAAIVTLVLSYIPLIAGGGLAGIAQASSPDPSTMTTGIIIGMIFYGVIQLLGSILQSVIMYAPAASAYQQLTQDQGAADVFT